MKYRICDHVAVLNENGENDIYRKFKFQFDNLLTADEIPTTNEEFEQLYVKDDQYEDEIAAFLSSIGHSVRFCVGYTGIGKTTSIRHCLELGVSNVTRLETKSKTAPDKNIIIFPAFFDGARQQTKETFNLTERISAVCTTLEDKHPKLRDTLRTPQGRDQFYRFIRNHTPRILEVEDDFSLIDLTYEDEIKTRLSFAQKNFRFEYTANKLKYYIKCTYSTYDRLVIVLDDIETLSEKQQDEVIAEYLHLYECLRNTDIPKGVDYRINLLISVRPHTLRMYQYNDYNSNFRRLESYPVATNSVLKKNAVDLTAMFKRRFDHYTKHSGRSIGNKDSWDDCYRELMRLNEAFDGKYKDMILNLCFMNVREALAIYSRIFANRFWVQGNKLKEEFFTVASNEYVFNNINVIRAIGCNNSAVFNGLESSVIPNFFLSTESEDYSIHCLLVMQYFIEYSTNLNGTTQITYGQNAKRLGEIRKHWVSIVGESSADHLYRALVYLFENKILRKSFEDVDDMKTIDTEDSLDDQSKLYISPRGHELMLMLTRDSVLLEMLRECAWREYEGRDDSYSRLSSYDLLITKNQDMIFIDLLEYIDYLREQEENLFCDDKATINLSVYRSAFGRTPVVMQLLDGVEKSLIYSGKIKTPSVSEKYYRIKRRIDETCERLQEIIKC